MSKEITYKCNVCSEKEVDVAEDLLGYRFNDNNNLKTTDFSLADIHICSICIKAIQEINKNA